jgi:hypothetical protein
MDERPIPKPTGTVTEITRIRSITSKRHREQQPDVNYPEKDTLPGKDSKG